MRRREFLQGALPVCLAPSLAFAQQSSGAAPPPPAPVPWFLGLNPATPLPDTVEADAVATTEPVFFSAVQRATLKQLAGTLLPAMAPRPGAVEVGAPAFLEFLIRRSPEPRQRLYTGGLDWLELQAQAQYGTGFAALSPKNVGVIITPYLRTWMSDHPPTEAHADFVNIAHDDIRTATINSAAWAAAVRDEKEERTPVELYWQPIQPDLTGLRAACAQMPAKVTAAPKAEHSTPGYGAGSSR